MSNGTFEIVEKHEEYEEFGFVHGEGLDIGFFIDGEFKGELSFSDGEPEDNNISRNFNDVHSIVHFMKMAYEAGKQGKELILK